MTFIYITPENLTVVTKKMQEKTLLEKKSSQGNYRLWHRNI